MFKRILIISLGLLLLVGYTIPTTTFAQTSKTTESASCNACGSTPKEIENILNMIKEILSEIRTVGTASPYLGKPVPPIRFQEGKFTPPQKQTMSKILRRTRGQFADSLAIFSVFWRPVGEQLLEVRGVGDSLLILTRNKAVLRDRKKAEQVENLINKKRFELSLGGGETDEIEAYQLKKITAILTKYKQNGLLEKTTTIENGITYRKLISSLATLSKQTKHFIARLGDNRQFDQIKKGEDLLVIDMSESAIEKSKTSYSCTTITLCNESGNKFKTELKSISDAFKNGGSKALKEFNDANKRFASIRAKKKPKDTEDPEYVLMRNLYGAKGAAILKSSSRNPLKKQRLRITGLRRKEEASKQQKTEKEPSYTNPFKKIGNIFKKEEDPTVPSSKPEKITDGNISSTNINDKLARFTESMQNTQSVIQAEAAKLSASANIAENNDIMQYFSDLIQKLTKLQTEVIGSKENDTSLIKNLGDLCSKQCANIYNKKCYY